MLSIFSKYNGMVIAHLIKYLLVATRCNKGKLNGVFFLDISERYSRGNSF